MPDLWDGFLGIPTSRKLALSRATSSPFLFWCWDCSWPSPPTSTVWPGTSQRILRALIWRRPLRVEICSCLVEPSLLLPNYQGIQLVSGSEYYIFLGIAFINNIQFLYWPRTCKAITVSFSWATAPTAHESSWELTRASNITPTRILTPEEE